MDKAPGDNGGTKPDAGGQSAQPGIGIARRASVLVTMARPRPGKATKQPGSAVGRLALVGTRSGLTGGPQVALERAFDEGFDGPPTSAEQVKRYRKALLVGNAGLIAAGVLAQRVLNHHPNRGPVTELGSAVARQVTIGAAAASIVVISDTILGPLAQRQADSGPATVMVNMATLRGQSKVLRKVAGLLTLPTEPDPFSYVG